jgi:hypothetical protein
MVVKSACREAVRNGWRRVGDVLVPPDVQVPEPKLGAKPDEVIQALLAQREIARDWGRTEYEVALELRPVAVRLAQVGDGALLAGAAAALAYGVEQLRDGIGNKTENRIRVNADRNSVVFIGNRDGSSASYSTSVENETYP